MHQTSKNANSANSETQQPALSVRTGQARILMPYPSRFDLLPKLESVENGLRKQFLVPEKFKAYIYIQDASKQFHFIPNEETWQKTLQAELLLSGSEVINLLVSPKHRFRPENHTSLNFDAFDFLQCDTLRLPIPTDSAVKEAGTEMQPVNPEPVSAPPVAPSYPEVITSNLTPTEPVLYESNLTSEKALPAFQTHNETQLTQPEVVDFSVTGTQMWTTSANGIPQNFALQDAANMNGIPQNFALQDANMNGSVQHMPQLSYTGEANFANGNPSVYGSANMIEQEFLTEKPLELASNGHSESLVPTCVQSENIFPIEASQGNAYLQDPSICVISEQNHLNTATKAPELPILHGDILSSLGQQPCGENRENGEIKVLNTFEHPSPASPDIVKAVSSNLESILEQHMKSVNEKLQNDLQLFKNELEQNLTSMVKETVGEMKACFIKTVSDTMLTDQTEMKSALSNLLGCMKNEMCNEIAAGLEEARVNQRETIDCRFDFIVLSLRKDRDSYKNEVASLKSELAALKAGQLSACSPVKEIQPGIANKGDNFVNGTDVSVKQNCLQATEEEPPESGAIQVRSESPARFVYGLKSK